jgi:hypothetical protein
MPERFQGAQEEYCFEVVGLPLSIFSVEDVEPAVETYIRPFYISEKTYVETI